MVITARLEETASDRVVTGPGTERVFGEDSSETMAFNSCQAVRLGREQSAREPRSFPVEGPNALKCGLDTRMLAEVGGTTADLAI